MSKTSIVDRLHRCGFVAFDARPYPCVVVPYDISNTRQLRSMKRLVPDALQRDMTTCNGLCSSNNVDGYNLILIGVRMQHMDRHSILAHELYHAINFVYRICGVHHDTENDEPSAYFLQDIYRQSLVILEGYGQ